MSPVEEALLKYFPEGIQGVTLSRLNSIDLEGSIRKELIRRKIYLKGKKSKESNMEHQMVREIPKFVNGEYARTKWIKPINTGKCLSITAYNESCGNVFNKEASITLDSSNTRQTVIQAIPLCKTKWNQKRDKVYIIVKDGNIIKIGGTRDSMKGRFGSYLCGHHVIERGKNGKMSVTNAHIYHTIENDLLDNDSNWEFYTWELPITQQLVTIFNNDISIVCQVYHAYESICIKKYKEITGELPILCDNADPTY